MHVTIQRIDEAMDRLRDVIKETPLQYSERLSKQFHAEVYLKREDLQRTRSFKIRGAYNKISTLSREEKRRGVVCASAGNHAQGVAYSCAALKIHGVIFMPAATPLQKLERVKYFGNGYVDIQLVGSTFDEAFIAARAFARQHHAVFVHPFNDPLVIAGQGTIAKEIDTTLAGKLDACIVPIGGGGLISGIATYLKTKNTSLKVFGCEPTGAASMYESFRRKRVVTLKNVDTFVDGCAVKTVGKRTFAMAKKLVDDIAIVPEGNVCTTMIELYQNEGIVTEPSGALSVSALHALGSQIRGKIIVCIVSGGNNDILRYPDIMERSLVYQGRKHYFIIEFAQKPGQLKRYVNEALGPTDDIARFEYIKKTNKEKGPALIGVELKDKKDYAPLLKRMRAIGMNFKIITSHDMLYQYLI